MSLLKAVFWLSLLILLIPDGKDTDAAGQGGISAFEVLSAAKAVWVDVSAFCERNPEACKTGNQLVSQFGDKARNGAKMFYGYLDASFGRNADDDVPGSVNR